MAIVKLQSNYKKKRMCINNTYTSNVPHHTELGLTVSEKPEYTYHQVQMLTDEMTDWTDRCMDKRTIDTLLQ